MSDALRPLTPILPLRRVLTDNAADTLRGIGLVCLAYLLMTMGDVAAKWALPAVGVIGAMVWRGAFGSATLALVAARSGPQGWRRLIPQRWGLVLLRGAMHSSVSVCWYIAWQTMNLADTYAIGFVAPLLMTLLAVPMLGERLRWRRLASTAVGFAGVLIMVRPGGALWTPLVLLLLVSVAVMAISRIMSRLLATTETPECLAFWLLAMHAPAGLLMLALGAFPAPGAMDLAAWAAMATLGVGNGLGHYLIARGYSLAPVAALAPYEYTSLIWGGLFGFLVFAELPALSTLAGAAVVAAAGLYNLHRERIRRAQERLA